MKTQQITGLFVLLLWLSLHGCIIPLPACNPLESICPTPTPLPTATPPVGLELIAQYSDFSVSPLYCEAESNSPQVAAPYDLVVSPDGQDVYWLGQRQNTKHPDGYHLSTRRYLYHLKLGEALPTRLKTQQGYPLDCTLGEDLEIDSQGRLYVTQPFAQEIYRFDPATQELERILKDTDLASNVEPPPAVYINEQGERVMVDRDYPLNGPFALFVSDQDGIFYRMSARNSVFSDTRIRQLLAKDKGTDITETNHIEALLTGLLNSQKQAQRYLLGQQQSFQYSHISYNKIWGFFVNAYDEHQIWQITNKKGQILELDNTIEAVDNATLTLYAGTGAPGLKDGPLLEAEFNQPHGLSFDAQGNLYVADTGNAAIRKISPEGTVSTVFKALP